MIKTTKYPRINSDFAYLQSTNINESLMEIKVAGYKNICFNSAFGWAEESDTTFLLKNDWVEGISIVNEKFDLDTINSLKKLNFFSAPGTKYSGSVDFIIFPYLKYLFISLSGKKYNNISCLKQLCELSIWQLPNADLNLFSENSKLEYLELNFSKKLESLLSIMFLKFLKRLNIYSAPNLRSIKDLLPLRENLTNLTLEKCPNIEDMETIAHLENLETLVIQNSAPIPSVEFIRNFKKLKYAYIGSEILDGKTDVLDELGIEYKKMKKYKK